MPMLESAGGARGLSPARVGARRPLQVLGSAASAMNAGYAEGGKHAGKTAVAAKAVGAATVTATRKHIGRLTWEAIKDSTWEDGEYQGTPAANPTPTTTTVTPSRARASAPPSSLSTPHYGADGEKENMIPLAGGMRTPSGSRLSCRTDDTTRRDRIKRLCEEGILHLHRNADDLIVGFSVSPPRARPASAVGRVSPQRRGAVSPRALWEAASTSLLQPAGAAAGAGAAAATVDSFSPRSCSVDTERTLPPPAAGEDTDAARGGVGGGSNERSAHGTGNRNSSANGLLLMHDLVAGAKPAPGPMPTTRGVPEFPFHPPSPVAVQLGRRASPASSRPTSPLGVGPIVPQAKAAAAVRAHPWPTSPVDLTASGEFVMRDNSLLGAGGLASAPTSPGLARPAPDDELRLDDLDGPPPTEVPGDSTPSNVPPPSSPGAVLGNGAGYYKVTTSPHVARGSFQVRHARGIGAAETPTPTPTPASAKSPRTSPSRKAPPAAPRGGAGNVSPVPEVYGAEDRRNLMSFGFSSKPRGGGANSGASPPTLPRTKQRRQPSAGGADPGGGSSYASTAAAARRSSADTSPPGAVRPTPRADKLLSQLRARQQQQQHGRPSPERPADDDEDDAYRSIGRRLRSRTTPGGPHNSSVGPATASPAGTPPLARPAAVSPTTSPHGQRSLSGGGVARWYHGSGGLARPAMPTVPQHAVPPKPADVASAPAAPEPSTASAPAPPTPPRVAAEVAGWLGGLQAHMQRPPQTLPPPQSLHAAVRYYPPAHAPLPQPGAGAVTGGAGYAGLGLSPAGLAPAPTALPVPTPVPTPVAVHTWSAEVEEVPLAAVPPPTYPPVAIALAPRPAVSPPRPTVAVAATSPAPTPVPTAVSTAGPPPASPTPSRLPRPASETAPTMTMTTLVTGIDLGSTRSSYHNHTRRTWPSVPAADVDLAKPVVAPTPPKALAAVGLSTSLLDISAIPSVSAIGAAAEDEVSEAGGRDADGSPLSGLDLLEEIDRLEATALKKAAGAATEASTAEPNAGAHRDGSVVVTREDSLDALRASFDVDVPFDVDVDVDVDFATDPHPHATRVASTSAGVHSGYTDDNARKGGPGAATGIDTRPTTEVETGGSFSCSKPTPTDDSIPEHPAVRQPVPWMEGKGAGTGGLNACGRGERRSPPAPEAPVPASVSPGQWRPHLTPPRRPPSPSLGQVQGQAPPQSLSTVSTVQQHYGRIHELLASQQRQLEGVFPAGEIAMARAEAATTATAAAATPPPSQVPPASALPPPPQVSAEWAEAVERQLTAQQAQLRRQLALLQQLQGQGNGRHPSPVTTPPRRGRDAAAGTSPVQYRENRASRARREHARASSTGHRRLLSPQAREYVTPTRHTGGVDGHGGGGYHDPRDDSDSCTAVYTPPHRRTAPRSGAATREGGVSGPSPASSRMHRTPLGASPMDEANEELQRQVLGQLGVLEALQQRHRAMHRRGGRHTSPHTPAHAGGSSRRPRRVPSASRQQEMYRGCSKEREAMLDALEGSPQRGPVRYSFEGPPPEVDTDDDDDDNHDGHGPGEVRAGRGKQQYRPSGGGAGGASVAAPPLSSNQTDLLHEFGLHDDFIADFMRSTKSLSPTRRSAAKSPSPSPAAEHQPVRRARQHTAAHQHGGWNSCRKPFCSCHVGRVPPAFGIQLKKHTARAARGSSVGAGAGGKRDADADRQRTRAATPPAAGRRGHGNTGLAAQQQHHHPPPSAAGGNGAAKVRAPTATAAAPAAATERRPREQLSRLSYSGLFLARQKREKKRTQDAQDQQLRDLRQQLSDMAAAAGGGGESAAAISLYPTDPLSSSGGGAPHPNPPGSAPLPSPPSHYLRAGASPSALYGVDGAPASAAPGLAPVHRAVSPPRAAGRAGW